MQRFIIALGAFAAMAGAAAQEAPKLATNQAYVEEVTRKTSLAIDDPMAVFAFVLGNLPDRVKVYPTENHYYFSFLLNSIRYAGNIKIDAQLRSEGKVVFTYYEDRPAWLPDKPGIDRILGTADGVTVEEIDPLSYRVSYRNKSVVFALNDLSQVEPPAAALAPGEQFIGPIFDDSAVRFFLVFDPTLKLFHYILDETVEPADLFVPAPVGEGRILLGQRTGFAVYRDQRHERKILIGVYAGNVESNSYLDGPFDQMPDNFTKDDSFRQALLAAEPDLKGQINRYGSFSDGERVVVETYMEYRDPKDLEVFHRCAASRRIPAELHEACFSLPLEAPHGPEAKPIALLRASP